MTKSKQKQKDPDLELFEPPTQVESPGRAITKARPPAPPPMKQQAAVVVPETNAVTIMGMIERLASNRDVDPEKFERLLAVQERLLDRNARLAFDQAFVKMQPRLPVITKDGRIDIPEKERATGGRTKAQATPYARWETIDALIKPILHRYGFSLNHRIGSGTDGRVRVTAILRGHGHVDDSCYFDLPADTGGSKNNVQAWVSSVSYAKRHTACAVLNIITKGEDDDGRASGKPVVVGEPLNPEQLTQLTDYRGAVECPPEHFLKHLNEVRPKGHPEITSLAELPQSRLDEAISALRGYDDNRKKKQARAAQA